MLAHSTLGSTAPPGRFRELMADTIAFGGRNLLWIGLISAIAALSEGAGLILLLPVLDAVGVTGSGGVSSPIAGWLGGFATLESALAIYMVVVGVAAVAIAARGVLVSRLRLHFIDDLRVCLHAALIAADWRLVARYRSAELIHVLGVEVNRTGQGVQFLLRMAGWVLEVPVLVGVAATLSLELTGLALICAAVLALAALPIDRMTHRTGQKLGPVGRRTLTAIGEDLASLAAIKCFGAESRRVAHFRDQVGSLRREILKLEILGASARVLALSGGAIAVAVAVWMSIKIFGLGLPETLILVVALARLLPLATRIQEGWRQVLAALPAHATARSLLAELSEAAELTTPDGTNVALAGLPAGPRLEAVGFHHASGAEPTLDAVTAEIIAGGHVAIVGASGAGKSTLAHILVGLLVPDCGRVIVDGKELDATSRLQWRRETALVSQDPVLFNDSIANNLRLARADASEADLWHCLRAAAADFVETLPEGLETVVGERGARLSGGERQRIALARALLSRPALLVLDEPTSALDPAGEALIIETLNRLRSETTMVTISHRPALARVADRVIVLEKGRVVGQGPWAELGAPARRLIDALGL